MERVAMTAPREQGLRPPDGVVLGPDVDRIMEGLQKGEAVWAGLSLRSRRELLADVLEAATNKAHLWVEVAAQIKGLRPDSPLLGEEWSSGPYPLIAGLGALMTTIEALEQGKSPVEGFRVSPAPDGRSAVHVMPHDIFERLLLSGFEAEVWTEPGVHPDEVRRGAGLAQLQPELTGGIGVVLGAGNIFSIAPLDTLYELFAHNRVVALKLNPITDPLLPVFEAVFAPLIDLGVVHILCGGADVGAALVQHPAVDHVHMTGSSATHDAIVFGSGNEGAKRKSANEPVLTKPMTSELGGVSPTIVLPGKWSRRDLQYQAEHVVTQRLHNNGYNCIAAQVLVLSADWPQKEEFLAEVRKAYERAPARPAFYPGSDARAESACSAHPSASRVGADSSRVLVTALSADRDEPAYSEEYFAPVLAVTELAGTGEKFLDSAVAFANTRLHGTLGANLVAHPRTLRELGSRLDRAIADLRYGTVAVNAWTAVGFLTARASWGAFPGHTVDDVQSGIGIVHNALLLPHVERTVIRGPFRPAPRSVANGELTLTPRPMWFVTNRTAEGTAKKLTFFAAKPRWSSLPGLFASALRG